MKLRNALLLCLTGLLVVFYGCKDQGSDIVPDSNFSIFNDESTLNQRVLSYYDTLEVTDEVGSGGRKEKSFELILENSLASPLVEGQTLQATSVFYHKGSLLVSYNFRGETYYGGADLLTAQFKLTSQVLYNNADINAVAANDQGVYMTGGVSGADIPAQIMKMGIDGNKFVPEGVSSQVLGSFAGTSLFSAESNVYVTTGDNETAGGGLYHLDSLLNILDFMPLRDARWIAGYDNRLFIAQGTPGNITVLSLDLAEDFSFTFNGANVSESKTTIEVADNRIFIAGGTEGVQVHSISDGSFLHEIRFEEGNITNAVTAENGLLFISNGEGGLYVASYTEDVLEAPVLIGKILYDNNGESVNHVLHRNNKLYVANGLGGIKMISVKFK